jgi:hypothetical protein
MALIVLKRSVMTGLALGEDFRSRERHDLLPDGT